MGRGTGYWRHAVADASLIEALPIKPSLIEPSLDPMRHCHAKGFSLIELMMALVVFGILMSQAFPMFSVWIGNSKLRTAAESVYAGLQIAKQEASRRNARVLFQAVDPNYSAWRICQVLVGATTCDPAVAIIQQRDGRDESSGIRVGMTANPGLIIPGNFVVPLSAGLNVPGGVIFDPRGRQAVIVGWNNAVRFDLRSLSLAANNNERRLVVVVSPAGGARMCDPQVAAGNPRSC